jgi:dihydropyrimidinase
LTTKGALEVGRDADLVVFDPSARRTITADGLHHTSDYTPYEGMAVAGAIRDVVLRGTDIVRSSRFIGTRGGGRFVERRLDG